MLHDLLRDLVERLVGELAPHFVLVALVRNYVVILVHVKGMPLYGLLVLLAVEVGQDHIQRHGHLVSRDARPHLVGGRQLEVSLVGLQELRNTFRRHDDPL